MDTYAALRDLLARVKDLETAQQAPVDESDTEQRLRRLEKWAEGVELPPKPSKGKGK